MTLNSRHWSKYGCERLDPEVRYINNWWVWDERTILGIMTPTNMLNFEDGIFLKGEECNIPKKWGKFFLSVRWYRTIKYIFAWLLERKLSGSDLENTCVVCDRYPRVLDCGS